MNILVCVKQVPGSSNVEVDPVTGVLKRDGVASKMNPYDLYGIELALDLVEAHGGTVETITMGPPQAKSVILESICMGAVRGTVLSDRKFAGADVLATAYTLSQGVRAAGNFDLIICGKQTTDGDTAQVGPAIAEHMGIPHAAWVSRIDVSDDGIDVEQQLQDVIETVHMPFPCLVTVEQDIFMPRLPSLKVEREIREKPIHIQGLDTFLDTDPSHYGLSGSPTQVERIFPPQNDVERETWTEGDLAEKLHDTLRKWKFI